MNAPINDWTIVDQSVSPWVFRCMRCGVREPVPDDGRISRFVEMADVFASRHAHCPELDVDLIAPNDGISGEPRNNPPHVCRCVYCDPSLDPRQTYPGSERTSEGHLSGRFGDWLADGKFDPAWFPIMLDGVEIDDIVEVNARDGVIWACRTPMHRCKACPSSRWIAFRSGHTDALVPFSVPAAPPASTEPYPGSVCTVRLEGVVTFGPAQGPEAAAKRKGAFAPTTEEVVEWLRRALPPQ